MSDDLSGPGYTKTGEWHGSVTDEVKYWKYRALEAEKRLIQRLAYGAPEVVKGVERRG